MRSMTGFGRGEASNGHTTVVVELKSVNNRFRDVQLRVPREYNVLESRILGVVRDRVARGRVDAFVRRTSLEGATQVAVDLALVDQYRRALGEVAKRLQRDPDKLDPLPIILAQPGVLVAQEADPDVAGEWALCETALDAALVDLDAMRVAEGAALGQDLGSNLDELQRLRLDVIDLATGLAERLRDRLAERLQKLLGDRVDAHRLVQEAAVLADKADIAEELARLGSHVDQFRDALGANEPVGRRLDFLLQEMNREVNTLGSKSAEAPISTKVVEMKTVLERLREQAANVE